MDSTLERLGVPTASSAPPSLMATIPVHSQLSALPPVWPRSAQLATALLLVLSLGLMSWHAASLRVESARPTEPAFTLDLNRADRAELRQLPGIGEALAGRIDDYRRAHGPFRHLDDLRKVRGIGPATIERLRPFVSVEGPPREEEDAPPAPPPPRRPRELPADGLVSVSLQKKPVVLSRIDINFATPEQLRKLPGIGPKLSERILETRQRQPFTSVDDLRRVPGIGPKTLERLRPLVTVDSPVG